LTHTQTYTDTERLIQTQRDSGSHIHRKRRQTQIFTDKKIDKDRKRQTDTYTKTD
jgi:hypothetical protein